MDGYLWNCTYLLITRTSDEGVRMYILSFSLLLLVGPLANLVQLAINHH